MVTIAQMRAWNRVADMTITRKLEKARMEAVAKILVERRVEKVQGDLFRSMGLTTPKQGAHNS